MYTAIELSKYILNFCHKKEIGITNQKLNAILYYIQVSFIAIYGNFAFNDLVKTSAVGVIVPKVYNEYYHFVNLPISRYYPDFELKMRDFQDEYIMEQIINYISSMKNFDVIMKLKKENFISEVIEQKGRNVEIDNKDLFNYYYKKR